MANFFTLTLDTTAPSNPTISIEGGAQYVSNQLVDVAIGVDDPDTTGFQMKIWGDVDTTYDANIQTLEGDSSWITFSTSHQIKLSSTNGEKTINVRIRDDVLNPSSQASDTTNLDTSLPVVNISGPDRNVISKQAGANVSSFSFSVSEPFVEYKVKVVSASGAPHDSGTLIPTTAGSTNTTGTGSFDTSVNGNINVQIYGTDLETASAGDGDKIVKVFAKDEAGTWSS